MPAQTGLVVHNEHPIGELLTEGQLAFIIKTGFEFFQGKNLQIHAFDALPKSAVFPKTSSYIF